MLWFLGVFTVWACPAWAHYGMVIASNDPIDFLSHNFIQLGQTRAKALQTVSRFPSETPRRYAVSKLNAFTLVVRAKTVDLNPFLGYNTKFYLCETNQCIFFQG